MASFGARCPAPTPPASEIRANWRLEHPDFEPPPAPPKYRFTRVGIDEMRAAAPITFWDRHHLLPRSPGVLMAYGPPGSHKTNILLSMCLDQFVDHPGITICYAAGEGVIGLGARFRSQYRARKLGDGAVTIERFSKTEMPNLLDDADMINYTNYLLETGRPDILIIDTFATGLHGAEEDVRAAHTVTMTGTIGRLAEALQCLVIVVHHTGHDEKHMRGASGFKANAMGVLRFDANTPQAATHARVFAERFRDSKDGYSVYYALSRDPVEGVPVPVLCTATEWDFNQPDKKDPSKRPIRYEVIEDMLKGMNAYSLETAKSATDIAARLTPRRDETHQEAVERWNRIASEMEKRATTDLAGLASVDGSGVRRWFVRQ